MGNNLSKDSFHINYSSQNEYSTTNKNKENHKIWEWKIKALKYMLLEDKLKKFWPHMKQNVLKEY